MRRTLPLWILALSLVTGACGSDDDTPVDPSRISLEIVSGDRQPARVAAAAASHVALPSGLSLQQLPDNLLPEPLVARIVVDGQPLKSLSAPSDPLGPSLATLPSDVVVTYRVVQPSGAGQRHCGDSFLSSAKPDAQGLVTTYWERGTFAGECRMEVRLVVDGAPRMDTAFVVEFEPGAPISLGSALIYEAVAGQSLDLLHPINGGFVAHDAHQNPIPDSLVARWTPEWTILGPRAQHGDNCDNLNVAAKGTGWTVPVVPPYHDVGYCLDISFNGRRASLYYFRPTQG